ncbi:hypothetical protein LOS73_17690 [Pseudoalteromonas sp. SCSIO 43210]
MRELVDDLFLSFTTQKMNVLCEHLIDNISDINATWHPLGFAIVKLLETESLKYRLHIWPAGERKPKYPNWPIHNHIFDLESLVVAGNIGSKNYLVLNSEYGKRSSNLKYIVKYHDTGSEIISTKTYIDVIQDTEQWFNTGEIYKIIRGAFHQSCVHENEFAASLVRTSNERVGTSPTVVGFSGFERVYNCQPSNLPTMKLVELIAGIRC